MTAVPPLDEVRSFADMWERLGRVPLERIRWKPYPGTATLADQIASERGGRIICEMVDGMLIEKTGGFAESVVTVRLACEMMRSAEDRNLGIFAGAKGPMRLPRGNIRIPDISFTPWDNIPGRRMPREAVPDLVPAIAVETLDEGNTPQEMRRKRGDWFAAGCRLVWEVDIHTRTVEVFASPDGRVVLTEADTLEAGMVLPGFRLPLAELFGELDRHG